MSDELTRGGFGSPAKPKPKKLRTNHLLIIGIDKYRNGISPLNNAVRDAKAFKETLLSNYKFEAKHVKELYDEKATKDAIFDVFDYYWNNLTEDDNLIFYFSGHGELHSITNRGYWIPIDATLNSRATYLPNSEVKTFFEHLKAHHVFGVVDSCFSGALFQTRSLSSQTERIDNIPSRWLLTAGRLELVADGSLGSNSPFAKSLNTWLKGKDDKAYWVQDLCSDVLKGISFNTDKQTPRGEPVQNVGHMGGQFVFYKKDFVPVDSPKTETVSTEPKRNVSNETTVSQTPGSPEITADSFDGLMEALKEKIALNEFLLVVEKLKEVLVSSGKEYTGVLMLQSRYNSNKSREMDGTGYPQDIKVESNQIRNSMIYLIDKLDKEDLKEEHREVYP